jgi:mevalonate kinase
MQLDTAKVGALMNKNHELLQQLTVSCRELDVLVTIARKNGAIGAKMTGTGRGGNMIALAPDETTVKQIAVALEKEGRAAGVWTTLFGL